MREGEFRGRRLDNGEWIEGDLVRHYENQRRFILYGQMAYTYTECGIERLVSERFHEVDPATVGQYTGLRDEDGKKIYEGDIVLISDTHTVFVEYSEERAAFAFTCKNRPMCADFLEVYYEVIGNIHDNPELLK